MNINFITLCLCFLYYCSTGQELKLIRGDENKTFKAGSVFDIYLAEKNAENANYGCASRELIGQVISVNKDSLTLKLTSYTDKRCIDEVAIQHLYAFSAVPPKIAIDKNDIIYFNHYNSYGAKQRKRGFTIAGALLLFTGTVTLLNAILLKDKGSKQTLVISGAAQIGLSIGFLIGGGEKKYYLKNSMEPWRFSD